jgi:hypothetical protein
VLTSWRIFNDDDGLLEFGLYSLPAFIIFEHKTPRRAVASLFYGNISGLLVV